MTSEKTIQKSKLIKLLSTFSALEWKRFGRFVQSPYYNTNQAIVTLCTILKKAFPFEVRKELEQERIYKKIYGKELFKLSKFQNLCSDLYELATDFMVDVHLAKEKRKKKKLVVDMLSERNYDLFKGASQQLIKEVETQEYLLDGDDFLLLYQLYDGLWHHMDRDKYNIDRIELEKTWTNLGAFQAVEKTQLKAENVSHQNILNKTKELEELEISELNDLFLTAVNLHETKALEVYFQFKEKVFENWDQLKVKHKTDLLVHLINFCITNDLLQKGFVFQENLELYKIGVRDKLFVINGSMRDIEFINICMTGFKLESADWTINFIVTHKQYLKAEVREFLVPLAYAYHALFQKDYEGVINLLSKVTPSNNLNYMGKIKNLLIRAYYEGIMAGEEQYRSPLDYEIEAFKKMMERNKKLSNLKAKATLNFLNLIKKLLNLSLTKSYTNQQVYALEMLIQETSPLILAHWLKEKAAELKNAAS